MFHPVPETENPHQEKGTPEVSRENKLVMNLMTHQMSHLNVSHNTESLFPASTPPSLPQVPALAAILAVVSKVCFYMIEA